MCCSLCFRFKVTMSDVGDGDGEPNVLKLGSVVSLANIACLDWKYDVHVYGAMPLASLTFPPWTETSIFTRSSTRCTIRPSFTLHLHGSSKLVALY